MIKISMFAFILSVFFTRFGFCTSFSLESIGVGDINPTVSGLILPGVPLPTAPAVKDWTVMFYSTTKDKLRYSLVWQLLEMKKIGSTARVNVVVEAAVPVKSADGAISTPTVRMVLGKAAAPEEMDNFIKLLSGSAAGPIDAALLKPFAADIIKSENNVDTGDWHRVADFTRWAKTNYPAKRYAFAIFGHGNGFYDPKKIVLKGMLTDEDTKNYHSVKSRLDNLNPLVAAWFILPSLS